MSRPPCVHFRFPAYELPDVAVERAEFFLDGKEGFGVLNGGGDLEPVANDAGIAQQNRQFAAIVAGDTLRVEAVEGGAIVLAFLQDGVPTQSGLSAFENNKLEENARDNDVCAGLVPTETP